MIDGDVKKNETCGLNEEVIIRLSPKVLHLQVVQGTKLLNMSHEKKFAAPFEFLHFGNKRI